MTVKFMVTGSMGCIGSWVLRNLVDEGVEVVAADVSSDRSRPSLLLTEEEMSTRVTWAELDITDATAVRRVVDDAGVTHIVHLAGLQIPFCAADPSLGAAVNVVGTVNVFEAARHAGVSGLTYASSLAVLGPAELYPVRPIVDDVTPMPTTLYGAYKVANESTARVYWNDHGVGSVGLRPYVVYGVGRDQGTTADLAKATLAAAAERPFHIRFDGSVAIQHANDVAKIFIAAARAGHGGASVCNLRNDVCEVSDFVDALGLVCPGSAITVADGAPLRYPADLDDAGIRAIVGDIAHTPLAAALANDVALFAELVEADKIDLSQLDP